VSVPPARRNRVARGASEDDKGITEERAMGVKSVGEKYRCNICGNEVEVTKAGGGQLVCCGQPMEKTG
jgi:desulfoferrodoxin-like iron-binding protein